MMQMLIRRNSSTTFPNNQENIFDERPHLLKKFLTFRDSFLFLMSISQESFLVSIRSAKPIIFENSGSSIEVTL